MYAIVDFNGTQIRVQKDKIVKIPRIDGIIGDQVESDKVLLFNSGSDTKIGTPYLDSAKVKATIYAQDRTKKTIASYRL